MPRESSRIPRRIAIVVCPVCGRKAWSNSDLRPNHYSRGGRCVGKPETVMYTLDTAAAGQEDRSA